MVGYTKVEKSEDEEGVVVNLCTRRRGAVYGWLPEETTEINSINGIMTYIRASGEHLESSNKEDRRKAFGNKSFNRCIG
jgi:hypothetical protein